MTQIAPHLTPEQRQHMALEAPMTESTPFDQQFMDQIDAEVLTHCPRLSDDPTFDDLNYLSSAFTDWFAGWDAATEVAARIVASRRALSVIPDGWQLARLSPEGYLNSGIYRAWLVNPSMPPGERSVAGFGPTWQEALAAAIVSIEAEEVSL